MDSKKVIEQLFKIAEKQQKIITKLAQEVSGDLPAGNEPPANNLQMNTPGHMQPVAALKAKISANPALRGSVVQVELHGQDLVVVFARGKSQAAWKAVLDAKQAAESDQTLLPGYSISGKEA